MLAIGLVAASGLTALAVEPEGTIDDWDRAQGQNKLRRPIIFVHGIDAIGASGTDCDGWDGIKNLFRNNDPEAPNSTPLITVKYYVGDTDCSTSISRFGEHGTHHGSGHEDGEHTSETDIRHLAYHFAWYVSRVWGVDDTHVDVVAHSMGGLIVRYALAQVARGHDDFPKTLLIDDVVTAGTPHAGFRPIVETCVWNLECRQMRPSSDFMSWLANNAMRPKPIKRTDWTLIGSEDDNWVASDSATAMGQGTTRLFYGTDNDIEHGDYYDNQGLRTDERAHWILVKKQGSDDWTVYEYGKWPGRWAQRALFLNDL
jgi:pimeloyl-ACP methyl ester carboxylesterase